MRREYRLVAPRSGDDADRDGLVTENFGLAANLTVVHALDELGFNFPIGRHNAAPLYRQGLVHRAPPRLMFPSPVAFSTYSR
ncbi:MAG: hypothetical protein ACR2KT_07750 [Methylocella sp.]|nr:MAG: hypothetical protein DLM68_06895 [Hyphomicrobiales bacterium]